MGKNYFITFEGSDGSGKGTQKRHLLGHIENHTNDFFGNKYANIWFTREPTKITTAGNTILEAIKSGIDGLSAAQLFVQDRIEHSVIIRDMLKHSHVICDRFDLSTIGYQHAQGVPFDTLFDMHKFGEKDGCAIPDITVFFRIPADVADKRIEERGEKRESYEKLEFLQKLEESYNVVLEKMRAQGRTIIEINADQTREAIAKEVYEKLSKYE